MSKSLQSYCGLMQNKTFVLEFTKENFIISLNKDIINGIHKLKNVRLNDIDLNDNIRITTNKTFIIDILHKSDDVTSFAYKLLFENTTTKQNYIEVGDNIEELLLFLDTLK